MSEEKNMEQDFQEIYHTGGKIEFKWTNDNALTLQVSGSNPWAMAMHFVFVTADGYIIRNDDLFIDKADFKAKRNYFQLYVFSDRNGLWGRVCPSCKSYFRTNYPGDPTCCPYCIYQGEANYFLTENQRKFIEAFYNAYIDCLYNKQNTFIDLDDLTNKLPNNKSPWVYSEEKQQSQHTCNKCEKHIVYDIIGEYGRCPKCGLHNADEIIERKLNDIIKEFEENKIAIADRTKREIEWKNILINIVSIYDGLSNELRKFIETLPMTQKRRNELINLSFLNIKRAQLCLYNWYDIDIFQGIKDNDINFLNVMFKRRHLFTHTSGIVNQEYIDETGDNLKLNQLVRLRSKEIARLIPLIKLMCMNFINGFDSILL